MTTTNDLRKEYNKLLKSEKSQEEFLNSNMFKGLNNENKDKIIDQYQKTEYRLNTLLSEIKYYTLREMTDGFEIKEYKKYDVDKLMLDI